MKTARFVEFKIFKDGHKDFERHREYSRTGAPFIEQDIMLIQLGLMSALQERYPLRRFQVIPTAFNRFNVVHEVAQA